jgi:uncharacterized damage-inducible protein DinB
MDSTFISEMYSYNRWANQKTIQAVSRLDGATLLRGMGNSFSSIRDTLVHTLGAEWIWLERWNGRSPEGLLKAADFPTLDSIRQRWSRLEDEQSKFIGTLSSDKLAASISYINTKGQNYSYPLWQQMMHVVNHSTYHRGQITTMLRQLGSEPVTTDLLVYYDEKASSSAAARK